ncbi:MAG: NAD-dependent epimerase/dehydratase family protein, partial [Rhodocyclaceae bacterium]|nr:NAD-dependent epimerase/dehydratase family protein [Rhodocyclaceae bacterium]
HLASIVTPGRESNREFEFSVDVKGTENVLIACTTTGVKKIIVSSSGAASGYHADNPAWLTEDCTLRGNEAFAYSHHKRLVEEMLARWRVEHPELQQVVFRIGTILGETVRNQITALFEKPRLIAIRGSDSPLRLHLGQGCGQLPVPGHRERQDRHLQRRRRRRAHDPRDRRQAGQALPRAAAGAAAIRPARAQGARVDAIRPGAAGFPALPPGAGQHAAEKRVRLRAAAHLGASLRPVPALAS